MYDSRGVEEPTKDQLGFVQRRKPSQLTQLISNSSSEPPRGPWAQATLKKKHTFTDMHRRNLRYWMELDIKKSQKSPAASSIYNIWSCVPSAQVIAEQFLHHHFYPLALAWRWRPVQKFYKKIPLHLVLGTFPFLRISFLFAIGLGHWWLYLHCWFLQTSMLWRHGNFGFRSGAVVRGYSSSLDLRSSRKVCNRFNIGSPTEARKNNTILNFCVEENLSQG